MNFSPTSIRANSTIGSDGIAIARAIRMIASPISGLPRSNSGRVSDSSPPTVQTAASSIVME